MKFSLRELFLVVVICALGICLYINITALQRTQAALKRQIVSFEVLARELDKLQTQHDEDMHIVGDYYMEYKEKIKQHLDENKPAKGDIGKAKQNADEGARDIQLIQEK